MRVAILLAFLLLASSARAEVPGDPPEFTDLELDVLCDITAPTLVTVQMTIGTSFDGSVMGIGLERSVLGVCESTERIDSHVYGELALGLHTLQFTDDTAIYGVPYRYRAIPLDSQGQVLPFFYPAFDLVSPIDYATCGDPVVGHGLVTTDFAPGLLEPCAGTCWELLAVETSAPEISPYVDTGVPVQIIGAIDCTLGNVEGCTLTVTEVIEAPCPVLANDAGTWSAWKARF